MTLQVQSLENGIIVMRHPIAGTQAITALISYPAGSRHESEEESGVAHFLEHLVFKGGKIFDDQRAIKFRADEIGAAMNAQTGKDIVRFHVTLAGSEGARGLDLLTDFVGRPALPEKEIEPERGVVLQEIARAEDQPATLAHHLLAQAAYGSGSALGRRILGDPEVISSVTREEILGFRDRAWVSGRGVVVLAGNLTGITEGQVRELGLRLPEISGELTPSPAGDLPADRVRIQQRDSKQSHLRLQWRLGAVDPLDRRTRAAIHLYDNILGGMSSSRLPEVIRGELGLCYSISSWSSFHIDDVSLGISAGLESARLVEAFDRILSVVEDLGRGGLTDGDIERARSARLGMLSRAFESSSSVAYNLASAYTIYGLELGLDQVFDEARNVTAGEVREVAAMVAADPHPAVAVVGPHDVGILHSPGTLQHAGEKQNPSVASPATVLP